MKIDTYYLVDFENVGSSGLAGFSEMTENDYIVIFFTRNARKIDMSDLASNGSVQIQMIETPAGNQSADMHISLYLGCLCGRGNCSVVIISKDTDYDNVIEFAKNRYHISVTRKTSLGAATLKNVKPAVISPKPLTRTEQVRAIFEENFNRKPYKEYREQIIAAFAGARDKQTLNTTLTRLLPSDSLPLLYKVYKQMISELPSSPTAVSKQAADKLREQRIRSVYGKYFKTGVYKEKREEIIKILAASKTRSEVNTELNRIIPGANVSAIIKQFRPILKELPS